MDSHLNLAAIIDPQSHPQIICCSSNGFRLFFFFSLLGEIFLVPTSSVTMVICKDLQLRSISITGDGRCLFRSVAHGASLRSGKPSPSESLQKELADELRLKVVEELVKRRADTEWYLESDFDSYINQIRRPHSWGGEPELLMCSHVLRMPISVYMYTKGSEGLKVIAEYGQEYGKDNPIRVLYDGYGHYDALQMPLARTQSKS